MPKQSTEPPSQPANRKIDSIATRRHSRFLIVLTIILAILCLILVIYMSVLGNGRDRANHAADQFRSQIAQLQNEVDDLKKQLAAGTQAKRSAGDLTFANNQLRSQVTELQNKVNDLEKQVAADDEAKRSVADLTLINSQLRSQVTELQNKVNGLEKQLDSERDSPPYIDTHVSIQNDCLRTTIYVASRYDSAQGWITRGWLAVRPSETRSLSFPSLLRNSKLFAYAQGGRMIRERDSQPYNVYVVDNQFAYRDGEAVKGTNRRIVTMYSHQSTEPSPVRFGCPE
jgi:hypothetical protein